MESEPIEGGPPSPGQVIRGLVSDVAFGGEGVLRLGDFVVFIPFVIPGEEVEGEVVEVKKSFARARLLRVLTPSPDRVEPACAYYGDCGGCQYQHIAYSRQIEIKHRQVVELIRRIGRFDGDVVQPVVPCPSPYHYRNRIMIRSQWDKFKQGLNIGFIRHDNRLVVDIERCEIAEQALSDKIASVRANPPPKGGIKVVLRIPPDGWDVPKDSFFQNNFLLLPAMVETIRGRLRNSGVRHLIDVYCGVGFFSVELAAEVESFAGVELDKPAILAARNNAARRGITHGEYLIGDADEWMPRLVQRFKAEQTAVILDPPRVGCRAPTLNALLEARPAQIIYVSCHPATLARDLGILCREGAYRLEQVVPLDMFPQTQHVECVTDLRRAD
jgi:tRNA/tmRNA/rRNA uracil-C5-methylase (TrmA/RlmC/RlmD family)